MLGNRKGNVSKLFFRYRSSQQKPRLSPLINGELVRLFVALVSAETNERRLSGRPGSY